MLEKLDCLFHVETPEEADAHVVVPQITTIWYSESEAKVTVYFMENCAYEISGGYAKAIGRKIALRYFTSSSDDVIAPCICLRKAVLYLEA